MAATGRSLPTLDHQVLERFAETLKPPFRRALESGRVDLLPPPGEHEKDKGVTRAADKGKAIFDEDQGRLLLPLQDDGRVVAVLAVHEVEAAQLVPAVRPFLASLVEAALDLVRLRLAAELDPVTGLLNELALEERIILEISRVWRPAPEPAAPAKPPAPPSLFAAQEAAMDAPPPLPEGCAPEPPAVLSLLALGLEGLEGLAEKAGRRRADQALAEVARLASEAVPQALGAGRIGRGLMLVLPGGETAARQAAAKIMAATAKVTEQAPAETESPLRLVMGGALLPPSSENSPGAAEAATQLKTRARRALDSARGLPGSAPMFFHRMLETAGSVREILPWDLLRVDLGRVHGAMEGQRFLVLAEQGKDPARPVAQVVLTKVGELTSQAKVVSLETGGRPPRPGDRLRPHVLAAAPEPAPASRRTRIMGHSVEVSPASDLPAVDRPSLMALLAAACQAQGSFAAIVFGLAGDDDQARNGVRQGTETALAALAHAAGELLGAGAHLGHWSPGRLAALLPGADAPAALQMAEQVLVEAAERSGRWFRAGVAAHPLAGFQAEEVLDCAAKALAHAGFFEPGSAVIFDAVSLNISGDQLYGRGRISQAVAEYERGLGLNPQEPNLLNSLGVAHGHLGDMDKAMDYFRRALAASPQDYMANYNLGYTLMLKGQRAQAQELLEKSLELKPDHADTLYQLGRLAHSSGRLEKAREYYERASGLEGCRRTVHRHLAEVYLALNLGPQAEGALNRALKESPEDAEAQANLAGLYLDRGANLEIALSLARRALDADPHSARYRRTAGRALLALGRAAEAVTELEALLEASPRDHLAWLYLGQARAARGHHPGARQALERALALEPGLEPALAALSGLPAEPEPEDSPE